MNIYKQDEIDELAKILKKDGIICVPTDTVYGLCGRMNSIKAYDKLVNIKNRPTNKPFPIMCADEKQIKSIALVDEKAEKLIHAFMPGPITLILNKKSKIPFYVNSGKETIAVRMATSKYLEKLIRKIENPIFMSSANKSGETPCNNIEEISNIFPNIDGIVEGNISFGKSSTIIDCTSEKIKILRQGPISLEEISEVIDS